MYAVDMSLNVKNPVTIQLVATLANRLNTSQVQAINDAVSARLAALERPATQDVDAVLAAIWQTQTADEIRAIRERQGSLYDQAGLPQ